MPAEASTNLARYDGVGYGARAAHRDLAELYTATRGRDFGEEVKRRIVLGTFMLSHGYYDAYYVKAQNVRALIRQDFFDAFREVDVIIMPTAPTPAFQFGEKTNNPLAMYLSDMYTVTANLAGIPAISLPFKYNAHDNLPRGLQMMARPFHEDDLFVLSDFYDNH